MSNWKSRENTLGEKKKKKEYLEMRECLDGRKEKKSYKNGNQRSLLCCLSKKNLL